MGRLWGESRNSSKSPLGEGKGGRGTEEDIMCPRGPCFDAKGLIIVTTPINTIATPAHPNSAYLVIRGSLLCKSKGLKCIFCLFLVFYSLTTPSPYLYRSWCVGRERKRERMTSVQALIQQDWNNREFTELITSSIKKITEFLNAFDLSARSRLAQLNEKLTKLERQVDYIEARVTKPEITAP